MRSFCYLHCPSCGRKIEQPFSIFSGPIPFIHKHKRCGARLIVIPDPVGPRHKVHRVGDGTTLEKALTVAILDEIEEQRARKAA